MLAVTLLWFTVRVAAPALPFKLLSPLKLAQKPLAPLPVQFPLLPVLPVYVPALMLTPPMARVTDNVATPELLVLDCPTLLPFKKNLTASPDTGLAPAVTVAD